MISKISDELVKVVEDSFHWNVFSTDNENYVIFLSLPNDFKDAFTLSVSGTACVFGLEGKDFLEELEKPFESIEKAKIALLRRVVRYTESDGRYNMGKYALPRYEARELIRKISTNLAIENDKKKAREAESECKAYETKEK